MRYTSCREAVFSNNCGSLPRQNYVGIIWIIVLIGAALTQSPLRRVAMFWGVYIHEMGHAVAALFVGGGVRAVRVHPDGSGHTVSVEEFQVGLSGAIRGIFTRSFVLLAGYLHPGLVSLLAAVSLSGGETTARLMLWVTCAVCAVSLTVTRGWRAVLSALATSATCGVCAYWSVRPDVVVGLGATVAAIEGLRSSLGLYRSEHQRGDSSDPGQLAETTFVPVRVWTTLFLMWSTATTILSVMFITGLINIR